MSQWIREEAFVEDNLLELLEKLGWTTHRVDDLDNKHRTQSALLGRSSFKEALSRERLKESLIRINGEWLTDEHLHEVVSTLERSGSGSLLESNEAATKLLLENTSVDLNPISGKKSPTVRYIDFENPENNDFYAVSQFLIEGAETIIPDLVLFVNGIPLVVIECKAPDVTDPIDEAVKQMRRYADTRGTEIREGAKQLFVTNALLIATCRTQARVGTISSSLEHFLGWKDPYPYTLEQSGSDEQSIMAHGMLSPANLLEIIQSFVVVMGSGRRRVKIACRYQQYRAVKKTIERVVNNSKTDDRSGVVWHTQGSGKSLTMVFLIRYSRTLPSMQNYKIVFVVDRTDLQDQLEETAALTGEKIVTADSAKKLKTILSNDTSDIIMTMMQKFNDDEEYKQLSDKHEILVMIDEAHRSQYSKLGANLRIAMPNAARIAFTGTPIEKTVTSFGEYIDTYTIRDAVTDHATVPIIYEGKTSKDALLSDGGFDSAFEDMFGDLTQEQQEKIKQKYGTKGDILSAPRRIEVIARDMVEHYVTNILPNGFKTQVVTSSRLAALRYYEALGKAILEYHEAMIDSDPLKKVVGRLSAAVVISKKHNDNPDEFPPRFTTKEHRENSVAQFKKPLFLTHPRESDNEDEIFDTEKTSQLAFIVVSDMLLTGFDAPIEQVMYLDKKLVAHNLLQAIARVNRTSTGKSRGLIVDYFGIGHHLKEALSNYEASDIEGIMSDIGEEYEALESNHRKVVQFFAEHKIAEVSEETLEDAVVLFADEKLRQEFKVLLRDFTRIIDFILPHPIKKFYLDDAKVWGLIQLEAIRRYRDPELAIEGVGAKVKALIDEYVTSKGVSTKVRPVSIFDDEFADALRGRSEKAKASEMEHALRYTIKINMDKDPIYYRSLAEKLEKIIKEHQGQWDELVKKLSKFTETIESGGDILPFFAEIGCDVCMPFYRLFRTPLGEDDLDGSTQEMLLQLVIDSVQIAAREIQKVDFWGTTGESSRKELENVLVGRIASTKHKGLIGVITTLKPDFMHLCEKNHHALKTLKLNH